MAGNNIKAARKAAGLTQKELAQIINVPYQSVQRWEKDIYKPNSTNLIKLANVLKISIEDIM